MDLAVTQTRFFAAIWPAHLCVRLAHAAYQFYREMDERVHNLEFKSD